MKLGLLGGTFNPVHQAHLRIAEEAREAAGLDQVLFIPAADPPHKPLAWDMPFEQRFRMVQLAIADNEQFDLTDIENRRTEKSYTVETIKQLRKHSSKDELYFIIGSDSFFELGLWYQYQKLFELTSLVVIVRPGSEPVEPLQKLPPDVQGQFSQKSANLLQHANGNRIIFAKGTPLDISSSRLREMVTAGQSIRYLVPSAVENYIAQKGLYRHE
ncbi:MAG: nicotinate-nucleotide adenylyltransferase [Trichlorobacter sp.]|jgi:nicotinate-nucleotide adenylyltransferase|nr:nicotinate-nucleotide adenylyltransferase [Trichlorobacter sp.]